MQFLLWSVLVVCALVALASLGWILWKQLAHLLKTSGKAMEQLGERLSNGPKTEELLARGVISEPRDVDVHGGGARVAELKAARADARSVRQERKTRNREEAYARWAQFNR